jgi:hypothetical protein
MLQAGSRYFYCDALGLMASDPCVGAASEARAGGAEGALLTERAGDCCQIVTLAAMPQAAEAARSSVAPAALVATLLARATAQRADPRPAPGGHRAFERWRPPPRASNEARAQLMVFLI